MIPTITLMPNQVDLAVRCDYDPQPVIDIKAKIDWPGYRWDKEQKAWIIRSDYIVQICEILVKYFKRYQLDQKCDVIFAEHKRAAEEKRNTPALPDTGTRPQGEKKTYNVHRTMHRGEQGRLR